MIGTASHWRAPCGRCTRAYAAVVQLGAQPRCLRLAVCRASVRVVDLIGSPKPRERVLDPGELRAIWQITAAGEFPFDPFVRLLLLLGCRRGELAGMRRDELDLAAGLWHLSGERTKNELPRTIPLSRQAVAILAALPVFPGPLARAAGGARLIQGLRPGGASTAALRPPPGCRTGRHDCAGPRTHLSALPVSGVVAELMIGHAQHGIRAVYDRYGYLAEQRSGFELWAVRLRDIVEPPPENVVVLREAGH